MCSSFNHTAIAILIILPVLLELMSAKAVFKNQNDLSVCSWNIASQGIHWSKTIFSEMKFLQQNTPEYELSGRWHVKEFWGDLEIFLRSSWACGHAWPHRTNKRPWVSFFRDVCLRVPKNATNFKFATNMAMPAPITKMRQWRLNFCSKVHFDLRFASLNDFVPFEPLPVKKDKVKILKHLGTNVLQCYWNVLLNLTKMVQKKLTHFMPLVSFCIPWKYQKTWCFLMFSRGIERNQW